MPARCACSVECTVEQVDEQILRLERSVERQAAAASSVAAVRRVAAERDLLCTTEGVRDLLIVAVQGEKDHLDMIFGGSCERIGRLRFSLESVSFSEMQVADARWKDLRDIVETIEAVLKDLGTFKSWVPPAMHDCQGVESNLVLSSVLNRAGELPILEGKAERPSLCSTQCSESDALVADEEYMADAVEEKLVEVLEVHVIDVIRYVPKVEFREYVRTIPKVVIQTVEKLVEVTEVRYVEKIVEVPEVHVQEVVRYVPKLKIHEVVRRVASQMPKVHKRGIAKLVPETVALMGEATSMLPEIRAQKCLRVEVPEMPLMWNQAPAMPLPSHLEIEVDVEVLQRPSTTFRPAPKAATLSTAVTGVPEGRPVKQVLQWKVGVANGRASLSAALPTRGSRC